MNDISKVLDPWAGYEKLTGILNSKKSLLINYKKIDSLFLKPRFSIAQKSEFVVFGLHIFNKLDKKKQKNCHVFLRPRDPIKFKIEILKVINNFTLDLKTYFQVYCYLIRNDKYQFVYPKKQLEKISPRALIINSTIDPVQRIWAFWAKKLKIKVICLQHGVFSSLSVPEVKERDIVDFYLSFGSKQSELIKNIIPLNKHKYLFKKKKFTYSYNKQRKLKLCLIGTDHERYGKEGKQNKKIILDIYEKIINFIQKTNNNEIDVFYKKHPSEFYFENIQDKIPFIDDMKTKNIDVYMGIASTLLMNMASQKICSIQISCNEFTQDKYEDYGICKTLEITSQGYFNTKMLLKDKIEIPFLEEKKLSDLINEILS